MSHACICMRFGDFDAEAALCALQGIPDAATLVDLAPDGKPDMATQREDPVRQVAVGATMLVKPGETV